MQSLNSRLCLVLRSAVFSLLFLGAAAPGFAAEPNPPEAMPASAADQLWNQLSAEDRAASEQFQKNADRTQAWKLLEKKITKGVPSAFVEKLLGKPETVYDDGAVWMYSLYYSSFLRVEFDKEMNLKKVSAK